MAPSPPPDIDLLMRVLRGVLAALPTQDSSDDAGAVWVLCAQPKHALAEAERRTTSVQRIVEVRGRELRAQVELRRRVCHFFAHLQTKRIEQLQLRIREKEDALRLDQDNKRDRIRELELRIQQIEREAALKRAQAEVLQLSIRQLEVSMSIRRLRAELAEQRLRDASEV